MSEIFRTFVLRYIHGIKRNGNTSFALKSAYYQSLSPGKVYIINDHSLGKVYIINNNSL